MRLLDLYCGAGMAADGYSWAGFEIVLGVDIRPQPEYPYPFLQADALSVLRMTVETNPLGIDVIHASPPCQMHTRAGKLRDAQGKTSKADDWLTPTLEILRSSWDRPWIVENVPGAPGMESAAILCGSSFGLKVRRHRLFESNLWIPASYCDHDAQGRPVGVYHRMRDEVPRGGRTASSIEEARTAMGVDRAIPWESLKEGFPPAYTRYIGEIALAHDRETV